MTSSTEFNTISNPGSSIEYDNFEYNNFEQGDLNLESNLDQSIWDESNSDQYLSYQSLFKSSFISPSTQSNDQIDLTLEQYFDAAFNPMESWMERFLDAPVTELTPAALPLFEETAVEQLLNQPEQLLDGPLDITTSTLKRAYSTAFPNGRLSDESKQSVNQLISDLDAALNREIHASVAFSPEGTAHLRLTAGSFSKVEFTIKENTLYSAHTHPSGILKPTPSDIRNEIPGAEDAVVVNGQGLIYG